MCDPRDGGYRSRKMVMAYVVLGLVVGGFLLAGRFPQLAAVYAQYCMALLGAASIYAGSNAVVKWVISRATPPKQQSLEGQPVEVSPPE